jgi:ubiquinone/menaquinone biosynthesis C-methylase UbiE
MQVRRQQEGKQMNEIASQAEIAAATAYEELFVAGMFHEWTFRVMDAAKLNTGHRVLDVACGTGVLAREAAKRVGPAGYVAGLDPNPGMLAVAKRLTSTVEWRQAAAESLPFPDLSFDAVVSQFGLMYFSDRRQAVSEMMRGIKSQGRVAVAVWDALDKIPAYACEVALLDRMAGKQAADALRAPFVFGDHKELDALFKKAGTDAVEIATQHGTARFPSIRTMVEADLRGWLPVMDVFLSEELVQRILEEAEEDLSRFRTDEGSVMFETSAHIVTGTKT